MVFNTLLRVVKSLLKTKRIAFRFFPDFHTAVVHRHHLRSVCELHR
jgi:hypothetical protein